MLRRPSESSPSEQGAQAELWSWAEDLGEGWAHSESICAAASRVITLLLTRLRGEVFFSAGENKKRGCNALPGVSGGCRDAISRQGLSLVV